MECNLLKASKDYNKKLKMGKESHLFLKMPQKNKRLSISILIPCYNEEKTIRKTIQSCFAQTRKADEIIVVNDGSTDGTSEILQEFKDKIVIINLAENTGNKSYAQEAGLKKVKGDVFITLDADSLLDKLFVSRVEQSFFNSEIVAFSGYIKSLKHNWLTACREMDYFIGQNIFKNAQARIGFLFVIPGCAGAFRTQFFKKNIPFEHDTITEDLDFTYKMHEQGVKIKFDHKAITYTQDPLSIYSYVNQLRRWYGGGWQNLIKHIRVIEKPIIALELSLVYMEGLIFSILLFIMLLINIHLFGYFILFGLACTTLLGLCISIIRERMDLAYSAPIYFLIIIINAWVFY